ncbi:hypothetical protein A9Q90_00625 [Gammaproteobacteria bacterium 54_18_T64]|nr:hypothetical protein A9Q90_00625 [Gammaproteobacteria bacterium 54_18_T64]
MSAKQRKNKKNKAPARQSSPGQSASEALQSAMARHQAGDLSGAELAYRQLLEKDPRQADATHFLGILMHQQGQHEQALELIEQSLQLSADNPVYHNNRGNILTATGHLEDAARSYGKASQLNPGDSEAFFNLAQTLQQLDRPAEAESHYRQVINLLPNHVRAHNNLGAALNQLGRVTEAIQCYRAALAIAADYTDAHYNLANALADIGHDAEALLQYRQVLAIDPNFAKAHCNIGRIYKSQDNAELALSHYEKALNIQPDYAMALSNMSLVYSERGDLDKGLNCCDRALALEPGLAEALNNKGTILQELARPSEAIEHYTQALQLYPDYLSAHWNLALAQLAQGNFKDGWQAYEWGLKSTEHRSTQRYDLPTWSGEPLQERALLVCSEQGIGDEVMFASCLPDLLENEPKNITLECEPRLVELFQRAFANVKVMAKPAITSPAEQSKFNCKITIGSLPRLFRPTLASFANRQAYLLPSPQLLDRWRQRFNAMGPGLKVGISWRGGDKTHDKAKRSAELAQWRDLLRCDADFINLQYGDCREDIAHLKKNCGLTLHDWDDADPLKDADNFAAQVAALDLVISVGNTTVHFAGALGVPCWVLLPATPGWRWLLQGEDSPWYPSLRLFRQRQRGDWRQVFKDVEVALVNYSSPSFTSSS